MGDALTSRGKRFSMPHVRRVFWVLLMATYITITLVTINDVLFKLSQMSVLLKLLELPLYAAGYLLLLPSLKIIFTLIFYPLLRWRQRRAPRPIEGEPATGLPVVLLYPTCNDFNETALHASMQQTVPFGHVYILDDSKDSAYRAQVDAFAANNPGVSVVRRRTHQGYKAGNMNAFLRLREDFEFFVVMDSDQQLAPEFVSTAMAMMQADEHIGIVQSRPLARSTDNGFTRAYAPIFNAYIHITQFVRTSIGFSMFMGRGALIRKLAYDRVGGFPELVMEDVPFSFELAEIGYRTSYLENLTSVEEYPINYHAFRQQQRKTAEGNAEFLKRYWVRILLSRLPLSQRVDLIAEHSFMLAGAFFGVLLFFSNILYRQAVFPVWLLAIFALAGIAPILPGVLRMLPTRWFFLAPALFLRTSFLYGSTLRSSLMGILRVLHGRPAIFHITPKLTSSKTSVVSPLATERAKDAKYVIYLSVVSLLLTGSIFSAMAFSLPIIAAFFSGMVLYQGVELGALIVLAGATLLNLMRRNPIRFSLVMLGMVYGLIVLVQFGHSLLFHPLVLTVVVSMVLLGGLVLLVLRHRQALLAELQHRRRVSSQMGRHMINHLRSGSVRDHLIELFDIR